MEKFLAGSVFISKTLHEGGLGPRGMVPAHWRITFNKPGSAIFDYSDVRSGFDYVVLNDGRLRVWLFAGERIATCDVQRRELTLDGIVYAMDPAQAATRPATLPADDPPLSQKEMEAIFKHATFSTEPILARGTPWIEITGQKMSVYRGGSAFPAIPDDYNIQLRAPGTILARRPGSSAESNTIETAIFDADAQTLTWRGQAFHQHPWIEG